jgi:hypothetical protein
MIHEVLHPKTVKRIQTDGRAVLFGQRLASIEWHNKVRGSIADSMDKDSV